MGIRQILKKGDEILTKQTKSIDVFDDKLHKLLDDMSDTLKDANGVGLAFPQIGYLKCGAIIDIAAVSGSEEDLGMLEMLNPQLSDFQGEQRDVEGCLSCPKQWGYVKRPLKCHLRAQNRYGEWYDIDLEGLAARCAMHECDHLKGELFVDLVDEWTDQD
ncbi:MAG: peptide deformylase [Oscillospiraceae bacterium]|jgi:peptide deformylase|nr:peptide deformylase [Oscillospiraceae bacterium]